MPKTRRNTNAASNNNNNDDTSDSEVSFDYSASERLWDAVEICGEDKSRYFIKWAGIDPKTNGPWKNSWTLKKDVSPDLKAVWRDWKRANGVPSGYVGKVLMSTWHPRDARKLLVTKEKRARRRSQAQQAEKEKKRTERRATEKEKAMKYSWKSTPVHSSLEEEGGDGEEAEAEEEEQTVSEPPHKKRRLTPSKSSRVSFSNSNEQGDQETDSALPHDKQQQTPSRSIRKPHMDGDFPEPYKNHLRQDIIHFVQSHHHPSISDITDRFLGHYKGSSSLKTDFERLLRDVLVVPLSGAPVRLKYSPVTGPSKPASGITDDNEEGQDDQQNPRSSSTPVSPSHSRNPDSPSRTSPHPPAKLVVPSSFPSQEREILDLPGRSNPISSTPRDSSPPSHSPPPFDDHDDLPHPSPPPPKEQQQLKEIPYMSPSTFHALRASERDGEIDPEDPIEDFTSQPSIRHPADLNQQQPIEIMKPITQHPLYFRIPSSDPIANFTDSPQIPTRAASNPSGNNDVDDDDDDAPMEVSPTLEYPSHDPQSSPPLLPGTGVLTPPQSPLQKPSSPRSEASSSSTLIEGLETQLEKATEMTRSLHSTLDFFKGQHDTVSKFLSSNELDKEFAQLEKRLASTEKVLTADDGGEGLVGLKRRGGVQIRLVRKEMENWKFQAEVMKKMKVVKDIEVVNEKIGELDGLKSQLDQLQGEMSEAEKARETLTKDLALVSSQVEEGRAVTRSLREQVTGLENLVDRMGIRRI